MKQTNAANEVRLSKTNHYPKMYLCLGEGYVFHYGSNHKIKKLQNIFSTKEIKTKQYIQQKSQSQ